MSYELLRYVVKADKKKWSLLKTKREMDTGYC